MKDNPSVSMAQAIKDVLGDSFYKKEELSNAVTPPGDALVVEGIVRTFWFHPERLVATTGRIAAILNRLPRTYFTDGGGGGSFLDMCVDADGDQWGEHQNVEELCVIGIASGLAKFSAPRSMWRSLPGGLPFITVDTDKVNQALNGAPHIRAPWKVVGDSLPQGVV